VNGLCERERKGPERCPLCEAEIAADKYMKHLGHHMQELALFTLPYLHGGAEEKYERIVLNFQSDLYALQESESGESQVSNSVDPRRPGTHQENEVPIQEDVHVSHTVTTDGTRAGSITGDRGIAQSAGQTTKMSVASVQDLLNSRLESSPPPRNIPIANAIEDKEEEENPLDPLEPVHHFSARADCSLLPEPAASTYYPTRQWAAVNDRPPLDLAHAFNIVQHSSRALRHWTVKTFEMVTQLQHTYAEKHSSVLESNEGTPRVDS